ncbi:MAG: hypothetical protein AAFV80_07730, partial [Bacteroidota bacterium]
MKRIHTFYLSLTIVFGLIAFQACKQDQAVSGSTEVETPKMLVNQSPKAVVPPFEGVDVAFSNHEVD